MCRSLLSRIIRHKKSILRLPFTPQLENTKGAALLSGKIAQNRATLRPGKGGFDYVYIHQDIPIHLHHRFVGRESVCLPAHAGRANRRREGAGGNAGAGPAGSISPGERLSQKYGIPERYTYEFSTSKDNLSISIDAKVEAPDAAAIPIYRVEMAQFTQEQASGFFDALCGDTEMWNYQYERTKDQLLDKIV